MFKLRGTRMPELCDSVQGAYEVRVPLGMVASAEPIV